MWTPALDGEARELRLECGGLDTEVIGMSTKQAPGAELTVEAIHRHVDGWYLQSLTVMDMELDVALVRIATIQGRMMALPTKAMRSQTRVITAALPGRSIP